MSSGEAVPSGAESAAQPAAEVFALDTCPPCMRLLKQLRLAKADFRFVDIELRPDAAKWVAQVNDGAYTVPTVRYRDGAVQTKPTFADVMAKISELNSD